MNQLSGNYGMTGLAIFISNTPLAKEKHNASTKVSEKLLCMQIHFPKQAEVCVMPTTRLRVRYL